MWFKPQVCADVCEFYLDPDFSSSLGHGYKFWEDYDNNGRIDGTDYQHNYTHQTDASLGWVEGDKVVHAWWADKPETAEAIFNSSNKQSEFEYFQNLGQAGYVDAVIHKNHFYPGKVTQKKNHSFFELLYLLGNQVLLRNNQ